MKKKCPTARCSAFFLENCQFVHQGILCPDVIIVRVKILFGVDVEIIVVCGEVNVEAHLVSSMEVIWGEGHLLF